MVLLSHTTSFLILWIILVISKFAKPRIYEEVMSPILKNCLNSTSHELGDIYTDTAESIDYFCTQEYLFRTPNERWSQNFDKVINTKTLKDISITLKRLHLDETRSAKVHYKLSSVKRHYARERRKRATPTVRKEYRWLSKQERENFHKALQEMKKDTSDPNKQPNVYDWFCSLHPSTVAPYAHFGPAFLGYHRVLLYLFEQALRKYDDSVFIPFWDSTFESLMENPTASHMFTHDFMGVASGTQVTNGPFKNWNNPNIGILIRNAGSSGELITRDFLNLMYSKRYTHEITVPTARFNVNLEGQHNFVHNWIGGSMSHRDYSPSDPLFFLHHCFIDAVWEKFRLNQEMSGIDPSKYPDAEKGHEGDDPMRPFFSGIDKQGNRIYLKNKMGYEKKWTTLIKYEYPPYECKTSYQCGDNMKCAKGFCIPLTGEEYENQKKRRSNRTSNSESSNNSNNASEEPDWLRNWRILHGRRRKKRNSNAPSHYPHAYLKSHHVTSLPVYKKRGNKRKKKQEISDAATAPINHSIQNTFTIDGEEDISKWVFIPVIVYYRRPREVKCNVYPIKHGHMETKEDVFNEFHDSKYLTHKIGNPAKKSKCQHIGSGATQIYVKATGLNYNGFYIDYAVVDERQTLSSALTEVGVKKPEETKPAKAYVTAYDSCGRACKPRCLIAGSDPPRYKKCTGVIGISSETPLMYSSTVGDAHLHTYDFGSLPPTISNKNVFIVFYCDNAETWPWD